MPESRPNLQQREAAAKSGRVRRARRLVREISASPALTRDQRAAIIAAATTIPVLDADAVAS